MPDPALERLSGELEAEAATLQASVAAGAQGSSVLRAAGRSVVNELLELVARRLKAGELAKQWEAAKADAAKELPPEEVEVGALASLLHQLAREAGRAVVSHADQLADASKLAEGRLSAVLDYRKRVGELRAEQAGVTLQE